MIALFLNEGGPNLTEGFLENPKGLTRKTKQARGFKNSIIIYIMVN